MKTLTFNAAVEIYTTAEILQDCMPDGMYQDMKAARAWYVSNGDQAEFANSMARILDENGYPY